MTDLTPAPTSTTTCPRCGAANSRGAVRCEHCGAGLDTGGPEVPAGQLELEEVWRAAGAGGYDTEATFDRGLLTCSHCGETYPLAEARVAERQHARDTASDRADVVVVLFACARCGHLARAEADADEVAATERETTPTEVDPSEVDVRAAAPAGATPETPLGEDRRFFDQGGPGTLADREPLLDDDGEDIRQYTGEPVETEEGWVTPRQQNVGPGNMAGGGEFPDPDAPPA
jgi:transcription elongation factor Elf1